MHFAPSSPPSPTKRKEELTLNSKKQEVLYSALLQHYSICTTMLCVSTLLPPSPFNFSSRTRPLLFPAPNVFPAPVFVHLCALAVRMMASSVIRDLMSRLCCWTCFSGFYYRAILKLIVENPNLCTACERQGKV